MAVRRQDFSTEGRFGVTLHETELDETEEWECQGCHAPLVPGDYAWTTDPDDLPDVWCTERCALNELERNQ